MAQIKCVRQPCAGQQESFWFARLYTIAYVNIPFSILFAPGPRSSALISDGCTTAKMTMTKNISNASKMYRYTSCEMRYPSLPGSFQSATCTFAEAGYLRTLRIFDQAEDATDPDKNAAGVQRVQTPLPQLVHLHALSVGTRTKRAWKIPAVTTKQVKKRIWTTRPPMITFSPRVIESRPPDAMMPPPLQS